MNKDELVDQIASLVDSREHYQRLLGRLALEYRKNFGGIESLKELSAEIAERHGLKIAPSTLHNYSWVEDRLKDLPFPEDVPFRLRQIVAGTPNPKDWVDKLNNGATTADVILSIRGKKPRPLVECPKCHFAFERPDYNEVRARMIEETKNFQY